MDMNRYKLNKPLNKELDVGMLLGSLQGCSSQNPMVNDTDLYKAGDKVCYTYQGSNTPVTLLEDVPQDRMTAFVTLPDGKRASVAVDWLSDISNCQDYGR